MILRAPSYRIGSFAFPAVRVESFLFVCEGFGLRGEHSPFFTPHFLPFLTEQDADGSEAQKPHPPKKNPKKSHAVSSVGLKRHIKKAGQKIKYGCSTHILPVGGY